MNFKEQPIKLPVPNLGFKMIKDGQYDLDNKRLCNLVVPRNLNEAVDMGTLDSILLMENEKAQKVMDGMEEELKGLDSLIEAHRVVMDKQILEVQTDVKAIKEALNEIAEANAISAFKASTSEKTVYNNGA